MFRFRRNKLRKNKLSEQEKLAQERKKAYLDNKQKIDDLYRRACENHEGALYIWLQFNREPSKLEELKQEINGCGACAPKIN